MGPKRDGRKGFGKLLDAWVAPDDAGEPIGCVATSFTFAPAFFEEECLGRFLQLETDPAEDGPLYLVERDEKLHQLACAAVLVDQHHCQGSRSMRWDILPARPARGVMHAKISVLHWAKWLRVIVASANLTEDGYRRNQEVFGVLDYHVNGDAPRAVLRAVLDFLRTAASTAEPGAAEPSAALARWNTFLDRVWEAAATWGQDDALHARQTVRVAAALISPGQPHLLERLAELWPGQVPPSTAIVFSPFFDMSTGLNRPADELWKIMRRRGEAEVTYCVTAEEIAGQKTVLRIPAPQSLVETRPKRESAESAVARIKTEGGRPLHAKGIWLAGDAISQYTIGSSNFTSAGLGLGGSSNYEANLCYITRDDHAAKRLEEALPDYEDVGRDITLQWQFEQRNDDEAGAEPMLPAGFVSAVFDLADAGRHVVTLRLAPGPHLPEAWSVSTEGQVIFYDEGRWQADGRPLEVALPWPDHRAPAGLWVRWAGTASAAWWPVNVAGPAALPPPDELRELPLDVLLNVLTSARPLHVTLREYLRRRDASDGDAPGAHRGDELDPHRRVDVSGFLLQRTRRVLWALGGLRTRLERPVATEANLVWRLRGPVGVMALADAIEREAKSEAERAFLLAELALELGRVQPKEADGCLSAAAVRTSIAGAIRELRDRAAACAVGGISNLDEYVQAAFEEAEG